MSANFLQHSENAQDGFPFYSASGMKGDFAGTSGKFGHGEFDDPVSMLSAPPTLEVEPDDKPTAPLQPIVYLPSSHGQAAAGSAEAAGPFRTASSMSSSFESIISDEDSTFDSPHAMLSADGARGFFYGARQMAQCSSLGHADSRVPPMLPLDFKAGPFDACFEDCHQLFGRRVEALLARMNATHVSAAPCGRHTYVAALEGGSILFSVQWWVDVSAPSAHATSSIVLRVLPVSSSESADSASKAFEENIFSPLKSHLGMLCRGSALEGDYFA